jgi:hypothetical protein
MASRAAVTKWLLDGDPAIRWQVMRDLCHAPGVAVAAERSRVAIEGWGAWLLARQGADGNWGGDADRGWMTTNRVLVLLKDLGVDPASPEVRRAIDLLRERVTWWQRDGRPFFDGETEACINGRILATGSYFGAASGRLLDRLLDEQLEDGGWNCDAPPSRRSSFNSTICVLEGLLAYERAHGATPATGDARRRGEEYLLARGMLRSLRSGEVIDRRWLRFAFPTSWHYDVLRGLDYLRDAGVEPDERVAEALAIVRRRRHQNGRWPLNVIHPDPVLIEMEGPVGRASRWITFRALRVLDWYEGSAAGAAAAGTRHV